MSSSSWRLPRPSSSIRPKSSLSSGHSVDELHSARGASEETGRDTPVEPKGPVPTAVETVPAVHPRRPVETHRWSRRDPSRPPWSRGNGGSREGGRESRWRGGAVGKRTSFLAGRTRPDSGRAGARPRSRSRQRRAQRAAAILMREERHGTSRRTRPRRVQGGTGALRDRHGLHHRTTSGSPRTAVPGRIPRLLATKTQRSCRIDLHCNWSKLSLRGDRQHVGGGCPASAAKASSDPTPISTRPGACDGRICEGTPTSQWTVAEKQLPKPLSVSVAPAGAIRRQSGKRNSAPVHWSESWCASAV